MTRSDDADNCGHLLLRHEPLPGGHEAGPRSTVLLIHKQVPPTGVSRGVHGYNGIKKNQFVEQKRRAKGLRDVGRGLKTRDFHGESLYIKNFYFLN